MAAARWFWDALRVAGVLAGNGEAGGHTGLRRPNFFGISRFLLRGLPKERIAIFANVTSMRRAFSRIKEPWDDASSYRHMAGVFMRRWTRSWRPKAYVLTDKVNTPAAIAREMVERKTRLQGLAVRRSGAGQ